METEKVTIYYVPEPNNMEGAFDFESLHVPRDYTFGQLRESLGARQLVTHDFKRGPIDENMGVYPTTVEAIYDPLITIDDFKANVARATDMVDSI